MIYLHDNGYYTITKVLKSSKMLYQCHIKTS